MAKPTIDTSAYGGKAIIHFNPGRHFYTVSVPTLNKLKVYQPGVTSILKLVGDPGPLQWWSVSQYSDYLRDNPKALQDVLNSPDPKAFENFLQAAQRNYKTTMKVACDVGKAVHDYAYQHLLWVHFGAKPPVRLALPTKEMNDQRDSSIDATMKFFTDHELRPISMERPVWSPTYGFIGTDDFHGYVDDELCAIDYKTSKRLYAKVWMQLAAYQCAVIEEFPKLDIKARWGVNVRKEDGVLESVRRDNSFYDADLESFLGALDHYRWDRIYGYEPKDAIDVIGSLNTQRGARVKSASVQ